MEVIHSFFIYSEACRPDIIVRRGQVIIEHHPVCLPISNHKDQIVCIFKFWATSIGNSGESRVPPNTDDVRECDGSVLHVLSQITWMSHDLGQCAKDRTSVIAQMGNRRKSKRRMCYSAECMMKLNARRILD